MIAEVVKNTYTSEDLNNVYKKVENVAKMDNETVHSKKVWTVTRTYNRLFSCEEAVERLIKIHLGTKEA